MTIFLVVLAILLLIALFPLGLEVLYDEKGLTVFLKTGPVWLRLYPKTKKSPKSTSSTPASPPSPPRSTPRKGGAFPPVTTLFPLISPALSGVKRRVTLPLLRVHARVGGSEDPASAAMRFGGIHAFFGVFSAVFLENFKVKETDLRCEMDFSSPRDTFCFQAEADLRFWHLLTIILPLLVRFVKISEDYKKDHPDDTRKEVTRHE